MQVRSLTLSDGICQGAKSGGEMESAQAKNQALKDAGAVVPSSYEAFESSIKETFDKLVDFPYSCLSCYFSGICSASR